MQIRFLYACAVGSRHRSNGARMSYPARALMAALAVFVVWTVVRACRSGTIFSQGAGYSADEQPVVFALGLFAHGFCVAFFCGSPRATTRTASSGCSDWTWIGWRPGSAECPYKPTVAG